MERLIGSIQTPASKITAVLETDTNHVEFYDTRFNPQSRWGQFISSLSISELMSAPEGSNIIIDSDRKELSFILTNQAINEIIQKESFNYA